MRPPIAALKKQNKIFRRQSFEAKSGNTRLRYLLRVGLDFPVTQAAQREKLGKNKEPKSL